MCTCTEPVAYGIGAVCVEYGRPKWPITMLDHTYIPGREHFFFFFSAPYARTTRYEEAFFPWKTKEKKARFARAPHDYHDHLLRVADGCCTDEGTRRR